MTITLVMIFPLVKEVTKEEVSMKLYTIVYSDTKKLIPSNYIFQARGWNDQTFEPAFLFFQSKAKAQEVLTQWLHYDLHNCGVESDAYEILEKDVT
jgi:hypothetical protein